MIAKFLQQPKEKQWGGIKRVMRYLRGTLDTCLLFQKEATLRLNVFSDADWGSDARLILNPQFPRCTKHIDIKFQFIRDLMSKGYFELENTSHRKNNLQTF